jgi:hypothetical protein
VVIVVELGREDRGSIPHNRDWDELKVLEVKWTGY